MSEPLVIVPATELREMIRAEIAAAIRSTTRPAPTPKPPSGPAPLLSASEVAALVRMSTRTLRRAVHSGAFPAPAAHVGRRPRWRREDLEAWLDGKA